MKEITFLYNPQAKHISDLSMKSILKLPDHRRHKAFNMYKNV